MGRDIKRMEISATTSAHNSDQDRKDKADWEEFKERVRAIAKEHRYKDIHIEC